MIVSCFLQKQHKSLPLGVSEDSINVATLTTREGELDGPVSEEKFPFILVDSKYVGKSIWSKYDLGVSEITDSIIICFCYNDLVASHAFFSRVTGSNAGVG